ncbi:MAG: hypothetical protein R3F20_01980 [Planctomycetota bacterium]
MRRAKKKRGGGSALRWLMLAAALGLLGWTGWTLFSGGDLGDGVAAFERGDWEDAQRLLSRRIVEQPDDHQARYYLGVALRHRRLDADAVATLTALRAASSWKLRAHYQTVRTLLDAGRIEDASSEVGQVEPAIAGHSLALEAKGLYHLAAGEEVKDRIIERLDRAIGDREARANVRLVEGILRADERVYRSSLDRFLQRLRERHGMTEVERFDGVFESGHGEFLAAEAAFSAAVAKADAEAGELEVARSRFELASFAETRKRALEAERARQGLLQIDERRFGGDLDLRAEYETLRERTVELLAEGYLDGEQYQRAIDTVELIPPGRKGHRSYAFESVLARAAAKIGDDERLLAITDYWLEKDVAPAEMNFLRGDYHFGRGDNEKAILYLEKAHNASGSNRTYLRRLAEAYMNVNNYDRANEVLKDLCRLEPTNWEAQLMRIRAIEGMRWTDEAREDLAELLRTTFSTRGTPGNTALREYMQRFLERNGLTPDDLYQSERLWRDDPFNFEAGTRYVDFLVEKGDVVTAARVATSLEQSVPDDDPAVYDVAMSCGRLHLARHRWEEAVACFLRAATERPYEADAFVGEARAHIGADRLGSAWRAVEKVRILAPDHPDLPEIEFELYAESGDDARVAETGTKLVTTRECDWPVVERTARALIATGETKRARALLADSDKLDKGGPDGDLDYAILFDRAGDERRAENLTFAVLEANPSNRELVARAARRYLEKERYETVVRALEPIVARDAYSSRELLEILVSCYEGLGETGRALDTLARLRPLAPRFADRRVAAFCEKHGAWKEILSLVRNARLEQRVDPELSRAGARAALALGDVDEARRLSLEIKVEPGADLADNALVLAKLQEAMRDFARAQQTLETAIPRVEPERRAEVRLALVDLLGRHGQAQAMMEAIGAALDAREDADELAPLAARHILALGLPNAGQVLDEAITRYGDPADSRLDRGLLRLSEDRLEDALTDLEAAHAKEPDADRTHALAMARALRGQIGPLDTLLRPSEKPEVPAVDRDTRVHSRIVAALRTPGRRDLDALLSELPARNEAEREGLEALIRDLDGLTDGEARAAARVALARLWTFSRYRWTRTLALTALDDLGLRLPTRARELALARSALLMRYDDTWTRGVGIVSGLLQESAFRDEAALMIYLEEYLANEQSEPIRLVVDMMLAGEGFSARAYRDAARLFLGAGRNEAAARLLHHSQDKSPEKLLLEARSLHAAGATQRAARLLETLPPETRATVEAVELQTRLALEAGDGGRGAYRVAVRLVRDFPVDDPEVLLLHARACFAAGRSDEGWTSIERYVAWRPASAAQVDRAIDAVNATVEKNGERRERLYTRLRLLDPASLIGAG